MRDKTEEHNVLSEKKSEKMGNGKPNVQTEFMGVCSVVIPAYNAEQTIAETVAACLTQDIPNDELEVIVVDDGSTDATARIVRGFPVRVLRQENAGPAKARNAGWRAARGELICFTDADCIPHPDWISKLMAAYDGEGRIGAVGGSYDIANPGSFLAECVHQEIVSRHAGMPRKVRALGAYNLSVRRSILKEIGGFSEAYRFASGEDNDLCYEIIKRDYGLIFEREALVAHHHPERLGRYLMEQARHGYWRVKLYERHPGMMKGDDYTSRKDIVEPPLCLMVLGALVFIWAPIMGWIFAGALLLDVGLQFKMACRVCRRKQRLKFAYLAWVTFLRGFARGLGMLGGLMRRVVLRT